MKKGDSSIFLQVSNHLALIAVPIYSYKSKKGPGITSYRNADGYGFNSEELLHNVQDHECNTSL